MHANWPKQWLHHHPKSQWHSLYDSLDGYFTIISAKNNNKMPKKWFDSPLCVSQNIFARFGVYHFVSVRLSHRRHWSIGVRLFPFSEFLHEIIIIAVELVAITTYFVHYIAWVVVREWTTTASSDQNAEMTTASEFQSKDNFAKLHKKEHEQTLSSNGFSTNYATCCPHSSLEFVHAKLAHRLTNLELQQR